MLDQPLADEEIAIANIMKKARLEAELAQLQKQHLPSPMVHLPAPVIPENKTTELPAVITEEIKAERKKRVSRKAAEIQDASIANIATSLGDILKNMGAPTRDQVIQMIREEFDSLYQAAPIKKITVSKDGVEKIFEGQLMHKQFDTVLRATVCGNVALIGPAGSGKTTLAEQVAKALNVPFYFTGALSSEYKLTGFIDAQGRVISTAFRKAYEGGGLFLFDEIDASLPAAVLAFNAALANGHADFPDGSIKRHKDFYCMAAANTFWTGADRVYVGRNQLDGATLDRFIMIELEYDEVMEKTLAGNEPWSLKVQAARKAAKELKIRHVISPRASIMGAKLLANGISEKETLEIVLWKGLDKESVTKIKAYSNGVL